LNEAWERLEEWLEEMEAQQKCPKSLEDFEAVVEMHKSLLQVYPWEK
jgi:hypothetical protein